MSTIFTFCFFGFLSYKLLLLAKPACKTLYCMVLAWLLFICEALPSPFMIFVCVVDTFVIFTRNLSEGLAHHFEICDIMIVYHMHLKCPNTSLGNFLCISNRSIFSLYTALMSNSSFMHISWTSQILLWNSMNGSISAGKMF